MVNCPGVMLGEKSQEGERPVRLILVHLIMLHERGKRCELREITAGEETSQAPVEEQYGGDWSQVGSIWMV